MNSSRPADGSLPRPGDVVAGKYRIESTIGAGGMGVVLGAQDTSLGRPVAIKFLAPSRAVRDGTVPRFLREARAAASIQSEHVVRVYEVGTLPSNAPFIVMEHLRGGDLAQILAARGGLPIEEAVEYLLQACEALGEAHGLGIVHRDLKPQNLFVTHRPDGSPCVKVLDFGISKAVDEAAPNLTSTDTVMGTPLYMSPEQVRSLKNVDHRSDIWALGAILFELLTASPIFEAPSATALCAMIAIDPPTPLRRRLPAAPPELEAIISRCLHKDPAGRFQDVAALAEALAPFTSERGRQSAARVSRVVRGGAQGHAATAVGTPWSPVAYATTSGGTTATSTGGGGMTTGTTGDGFGPQHRPSYLPPQQPHAPSGYPAPMAAASGYSGYPAAPPSHPSTQSAWGHQTGPGPTPAKSSSGLVLGVAGALVGIVILGGVAAGGAWLMWQRSVAAEQAANAQDAGAAPVPSAVETAPAATASVAVAAAATTPTPAVAAAATKKAAAGDPSKGGGAPAAAKDAGAPAPATASATPAAAPTPSKEEQDLEAQKRSAQASCNHHSFLLRQNDRSNNNNARTVKNLVCPRATGPNGATCERSLCRQACTILDDKLCQFQLDNAERNFKPKF